MNASRFIMLDSGDESVYLIEWEHCKSLTVIVIFAIILILGIAARVGIIKYVTNYAPSRPINWMILMDQVK